MIFQLQLLPQKSRLDIEYVFIGIEKEFNKRKSTYDLMWSELNHAFSLAHLVQF